MNNKYDREKIETINIKKYLKKMNEKNIRITTNKKLFL